jgi:hypothetical protein
MTIVPQHNGLVLLCLFAGRAPRRFLVSRAVLVVELEEGWPTAKKMLSQATEALSKTIA